MLPINQEPTIDTIHLGANIITLRLTHLIQRVHILNTHMLLSTPVLQLGTRRGKKTKHDTHALQGLKVMAGAVSLNAGEILYRHVFGHKFVSKNEAMQDFVASFLVRSSATAEAFHVQLASPIVKCDPAWKRRKIHVAMMFNHKRSHPRTLAACGIMSIMMLLY